MRRIAKKKPETGWLSPQMEPLKPHIPTTISRLDLGFTGTYSSRDFNRMIRGLKSHGMDEKWDVIYKRGWLYFHRSWTGVCVFGVRFEPAPPDMRVAKSWVNKNAFRDGFGSESQLVHQRDVLGFLIDAFLLRKAVSFPLPDGLEGLRALGYMHHIAGYPPGEEKDPIERG